MTQLTCSVMRVYKPHFNEGLAMIEEKITLIKPS